MLTLITGDDIVSSRQALVKIKAEAGPLEIVNWPKEQDPAVFLQENLSLTLLGGKRLLIFEVERWEKGFESPKMLEALENLPEETEVVFWVGGELTPTNPLVQKVRKQRGRILEFAEKVPRNVFPFLEALAMKNLAGALGKLSELLASGMEPIFLVAMIAYELRVLLRVKLGATEGLSPFVVTKAKRAVGRFSEASLVTAFANTLAADLTLKSSQLPQDLVLTNLVLSIVSN